MLGYRFFLMKQTQTATINIQTTNKAIWRSVYKIEAELIYIFAFSPSFRAEAYDRAWVSSLSN